MDFDLFLVGLLDFDLFCVGLLDFSLCGLFDPDLLTGLLDVDFRLMGLLDFDLRLGLLDITLCLLEGDFDLLLPFGLLDLDLDLRRLCDKPGDVLPLVVVF